MRISSLRWWHWMVISVLVGLAVGYARKQGDDDLYRRFGEPINNQGVFEDALAVRTEQGRPAFDRVTVHTQMLPDGKGAPRPVQVVSGVYFSGHYDVEGGNNVAHWRPAFFVAPPPYKPRMNLARLAEGKSPADRKAMAEQVKAYRGLKEATVVDFLNLVHQTRGVSYKHAWWREIGVRWYVLASFVLIGLIWPPVVNLLAFGSLRRPPEEKAADLSAVKAHAESPQPAVDAGLLQATNSELTRKLADGESPPATVEPALATSDVPPRPLESAPLEPAAAPRPEDHPEYGMGKDDFYPTELHPPEQEEKK